MDGVVVMHLDLTQKALTVIQVLTSEDICMDNAQRLDMIYKFAHVAEGKCKNPHLDWVTELETTYEDFQYMKLIGEG